MSQINLKKARDPSILILDFGSQYSELIARRIRETNVFSLVVSNCISIEYINDINPKGIILSGAQILCMKKMLLNVMKKFLTWGFLFLVYAMECN